MSDPRSVRWFAAGLAALLTVGLGYGGWRWFGPYDTSPNGRKPHRVDAEGAADPAAVEAKATAFCGGCHRMPNPAYFTRDRWHEEVERGYRFHAVSSRLDLTAPPLRDVAAFFRERAPAKLEVPRSTDEPDGSFRFEQVDVEPPADSATEIPAISFLQRAELVPGGPSVLLACDMGSGDLLAIDPTGERPQARRLANVGHPAHVTPCDLDRDGATDLAVADLGSFLPEDHDRGRVVWLRNVGRSEYERVVLLDQVGRVADVRPGDFDGDGDEDLIVAEFGWQKTGSIHVLVNERDEGGTPRFSRRLVDGRHGTIHVPVLDWNEDGQADFFALVSQEHETIELFLNEGDSSFRGQTINPPEDPAFGSSGIEVTDLDGDSDRDVLYTNGDTFDSYELKPYHGVQWIENRAAAGWATRRITAMPGVHRALAGDLDGDGDVDVIAAALLPERLFDGNGRAADFDSLIWLEQVRPGEFVRHGLERGSCHHAALELADFNGDGRLDIAVGNFQEPGKRSPVTIWKNLPAQRAEASERDASP
jgi:hypothetical protein